MEKNPVNIIGLPVYAGTKNSFTETIIDMTQNKNWGYVCLANVHMLVEAKQSRRFKQVYKSANLAVPDGQPLAIIQKQFYSPEAERYCGRDLVLRTCKEAAERGINVGFYGSTEPTLTKATEKLKVLYPQLSITYLEAGPNLPRTPGYDEQTVENIRRNNVDLLFVCLGCPKQEYWMHHNSQPANTVSAGIGAAIDFIAGTKKVAPPLLQKLGLEWAYRLAREPKRLWWRYMKTNTLFIFLALWSAIRFK